MQVRKKNQIVITTLVIMIAVAGYYNFNIGKNNEEGNNFVFNGIEEQSDLASALVPNENVQVDVQTTLNQKDDKVPIADDKEPKANEEIKESTVAQGETNEDVGTAIFVSSPIVNSDFFVEAKITREQTRSKSKDMLYELINNENVPNDKKSEAASQLISLQERISQEAETESMIKAKGFDQVYVRIDKDSVDVVVDNEVLSEAEKAKIEDVVRRKTGMTVDKIRISPLKSKN